VLDVGRRLGKLLQSRLGADVATTRKDDTFIPLRLALRSPTRNRRTCSFRSMPTPAAIPDARGVETYYLNFTSSAEALDVAAREMRPRTNLSMSSGPGEEDRAERKKSKSRASLLPSAARTA